MMLPVSAEDRIKDAEKMRRMQIECLQETQCGAIDLRGLCQ